MYTLSSVPKEYRFSASEQLIEHWVTEVLPLNINYVSWERFNSLMSVMRSLRLRAEWPITGSNLNFLLHHIWSSHTP